MPGSIASAGLWAKPGTGGDEAQEPTRRRTLIAVLIPCSQEELTIGKVVQDFRRELPEARIYVFDNNCTDNTAEVARQAGAMVRREKRQGKGFVVARMFEQIDVDILVMVDRNDTHEAEAVHALMEQLLNWTGGRAERFQFAAAKPWVRAIGNTERLIVYYLSPPVMPFANYWNEHLAPRPIPAQFRSAAEQSFTLNGATLLSLEGLQTDSAGLGVGVALVLAVSTRAVLRVRRKPPAPQPQLGRRAHWLILAVAAVVFLVLLRTSFVKSTVRLLCPYYPLLVVPFLRARGIHYVLAPEKEFDRGFFSDTFESWLAQMNGEVVQTIPLFLRQRMVRNPGISSSCTGGRNQSP